VAATDTTIASLHLYLKSPNIMKRIWHSSTDKRTLFILGFVAFAIFLFLAADLLEIDPAWVVVILDLLIWLALWLLKRKGTSRWLTSWRMRWRSRRHSHLRQQRRGPARRRDSALRQRMLEAINTIKTSKLGQKSGTAALYELPWYMVIGNPAAGKRYGHRQFRPPVPVRRCGRKIVQGMGGTRIATGSSRRWHSAGHRRPLRVYDDDRGEWFSFLGMLKQYRKQAPINGIIIAVSIADLTGS
jgi:type VI secretion system protein ImpL